MGCVKLFENVAVAFCHVESNGKSSFCKVFENPYCTFKQLAGEATVPYGVESCCEVDKHSSGFLFS